MPGRCRAYSLPCPPKAWVQHGVSCCHFQLHVSRLHIAGFRGRGYFHGGWWWQEVVEACCGEEVRAGERREKSLPWSQLRSCAPTGALAVDRCFWSRTSDTKQGVIPARCSATRTGNYSGHWVRVDTLEKLWQLPVSAHEDMGGRARPGLS